MLVVVTGEIDPDPIEEPLLVKATVPVGVAPTVLTRAVSVSGCPAVTGFLFVLRDIMLPDWLTSTLTEFEVEASVSASPL